MAIGIQAVPALIVPILASALPLVRTRSRRVARATGALASVILLTFIVLAILSVGWFYVPSLVAALAFTATAVPPDGS